ncbi:MAG: oligosaccharide flippase family protein [Coprococcus sp.]
MKNNLGKSIVYQTVYQILVLLLPIVTSPYVSRVLGAERIGIYSYSYSVANYFVLVAALGINNHGSRVIAETKNDKKRLNQTFSDLFTLHLIIASIVFVLYLVYAFLLVKEDRLYAIIQLFYVASAIFDINWLFFGLEQFRITVTRNILIKLLTVICIFAFVKNESDLWKYCLIMSVGYFISQSLVWAYVNRFVSFVRPKWNGMKANIKPMVLLFIPAIAVSLYKIMDKIMLGMMSTRDQVGFYENSEKVINILMGFITAFGTVMLPRMSNLISNGEKELAERYMDNSIEVVMCIAVALSFGLLSIANRFTPFFFGAGFEECGEIMRILSSTIIFVAFANVIRTQFLIPNHFDRIYLISVCCGAIVNIAVNYMLIPMMQGRGAAIGTVCAEIVVCLIQFFGIIKRVNWKKYLKYTVVFVLTGIVMKCCVSYVIGLFTSTILALGVGIFTGGVIYSVFVALYLVSTKDELWLQLLLKIKKKKRL